MVRAILSAICLIGLCGSNSASAQTDNFEAYLDGLVAAQFNSHDLAGMTFVLVQDCEVTLLKGYGEVDLLTGEQVDPARHLFRPGSVSKLFTWTAVMQLVEQGKLNLDANLTDYVHQFDLPNAFDSPLTMSHLMTHTPGLEDGAAGFLFADDPSDLVPLADFLAAHIPTQVRPPGTNAAYSNWGTALAGLVVANISGKSFEQYIEDHIFSPLGMTQATFEEPLPPHLTEQMTTGYVVEKGELKPFGFEYIKNFGPAGALSASSGAMAKFMLAHLNQGQYNGAQLLAPATVRLMHSRLFAHTEGVAASAHGFYESWRSGQRFIGHGGDTIAFHSELLIDPERKFGFFLSFNTPDGARARSAIVAGIIDFFYPTEPKQWTFPALDGSASRVQEVAGTYRFNRRSYTKLEGITAFVGDFTVVAELDGSIHIPVPDVGGIFREVEPYVFQKAGSQARLVFTKSDANQIDRMLIANVPVMVADRIGPLETSSTHQIIILLTVLACVFVLINTIRNRKLVLSGAASMGRRLITLTALTNVIFLIVWGAVLANIDINRVIFDFPPPGTGFALVFPIISSLLTLACVAYLVPVWRSPECGIWARLRYGYVTIVFVFFIAILQYWNLIGWNY